MSYGDLSEDFLALTAGKVKGHWSIREGKRFFVREHSRALGPHADTISSTALRTSESANKHSATANKYTAPGSKYLPSAQLAAHQKASNFHGKAAAQHLEHTKYSNANHDQIFKMVQHHESQQKIHDALVAKLHGVTSKPTTSAAHASTVLNKSKEGNTKDAINHRAVNALPAKSFKENANATLAGLQKKFHAAVNDASVEDLKALKKEIMGHSTGQTAAFYTTPSVKKLLAQIEEHLSLA